MTQLCQHPTTCCTHTTGKSHWMRHKFCFSMFIDPKSREVWGPHPCRWHLEVAFHGFLVFLGFFLMKNALLTLPCPLISESQHPFAVFCRSQSWMSAQQCSGTAQLSCELTEEFRSIFNEYSVFVQSLGGAQVLNSSVLRFVPYSQSKFFSSFLLFVVFLSSWCLNYVLGWWLFVCSISYTCYKASSL